MADNNVLFQLPDEILALVVEFTARGLDYGSHPECLQCSAGETTQSWDRSSIVALSQVSRRLARLAQPVLFRNIQISYPYRTDPRTGPGIELHRSLKENPELRKHCR